VKNVMLEKETATNFPNYMVTVTRFYWNKHFMGTSCHQVCKHYFHVLAGLNKMFSRQCLISVGMSWNTVWSTRRWTSSSQGCAFTHSKEQYFERLLNWNITFSCWTL